MKCSSDTTGWKLCKQRLAGISMIVIILMIVVIVVAATVVPAGAQTGVKRFSELFGYVDVAACILFHPLMDYYSVSAETFSKKPQIGQTRREIKLEMASKLGDWGKQLRESKKRIEEYRKEIKKLEARQSRVKQKMKDDLEKERVSYVRLLDSTELESESKRIELEYAARCEEIESGYLQQIKKIRAAIENYGTRYQDLKRKVNEILYQGVHDKQATVKIILEDIELVLRLVAKKRGLSVVANSTVIREGRREKPSSWKDIFKEKYDYERFEEALFEGWLKPPDLYAEYSKRFRHKDEYLKPFGTARLLNDVFVIGGTDITEDVITGLLIKYKVSGKQMDKALELFKEYRESRFGW